jgi:hypothetical protein
MALTGWDGAPPKTVVGEDPDPMQALDELEATRDRRARR